MFDFYALWLPLAVSFSIVGYGLFVGRNKFGEVKNLYRAKFVAMALIPLFIPFTYYYQPSYFSSFSRIENLDKLESDKLASIEELNGFEKKQTVQVEALKTEVIHLREDLRKLTESTRIIFMIFYVFGLTFCLTTIFKMSEKIGKLSNDDKEL